jgi:hypothetical protein
MEISVTQKVKIDLPYDPTILLLGIYLKKLSQHTVEAPAHPCLSQH